jgi:hypothetical protein
MPRLSSADHHQAIGMLQAGMSQGEVAAHFQCNRDTISALVRRQRVRNDVTDRPRSGRPHVTTARPDRWIQVTHLRNRRLTAADTAGVILIPGNRRIHPMTILGKHRNKKHSVLYIILWCLLFLFNRNLSTDLPLSCLKKLSKYSQAR